MSELRLTEEERGPLLSEMYWATCSVPTTTPDAVLSSIESAVLRKVANFLIAKRESPCVVLLTLLSNEIRAAAEGEE